MPTIWPYHGRERLGGIGITVRAPFQCHGERAVDSKAHAGNQSRKELISIPIQES